MTAGRTARLAALGLSVALLAGSAGPPRTLLVVCAPGFPGSTVQAQPTMDAFARALEEAKPGGVAVAAVYHETEAAGVDRLRDPDAKLALVTFPFFVKYRRELALEPRLVAVGDSGAEEVWSLVAKRGAIRSPASLEGWEITGLAGFSPEFVRGPVLREWGALPGSTQITFTSRVASALLKAASGEKLAVLLDRESATALDSHPRGADLEVVARSGPLPASLVCSVGPRGKGPEAESVVQALASLARRAEGSGVLASLRLSRFEPVRAGAIESLASGEVRGVSAPSP